VPCLAHAINLVGAQIVDENDIALFQGRRENLLDIRNKCRPIHRAIDDIGHGDATEPRGSDERQRLPVTVWHARDRPLAARAATVVTDHFCRNRDLVNEHQARRLDRSLLRLQFGAPTRNIRTTLLGGVQSSF